MTQVTILGANGQIARLVRQRLSDAADTDVILFARGAQRLGKATAHEKILEGDATSQSDVAAAVEGSDIVYANLSGSTMDDQARVVVDAMKSKGVSRLVWISSLGIYDEVPGAFGVWNNDILKDYLPPYARAAAVIEGSGLDWTVIRPAWLTNKTEIEYETTVKPEPFKGTEVSRASIADLVVAIIHNPEQYQRQSVGVDKPGTEGDKPAWY